MEAGIRPVRLRCEYQENPLGVDATTPRLSWQLDLVHPGDRGQVQTAYQILVSNTEEALAANSGDMWDSEKVSSDQSILVPYAGKPLLSRRKYFWKVRVWDKNRLETAWSAPSTWSMGLLDPSDWQGQWISASTPPPDPLTHPALLMRREFHLEKIPSRAVVYICGLGYYELSLNGKKVGDHKLDPAFTDYSKRVFYVVYEVDIKKYLVPGNNTLGVILGGGWFHLATPDGFEFYQAPWTAPPKLLLNLDLDYPDNSRQTVATGPDWTWSTGAITFNCVRGGETVDARADKPGWNSNDYNDTDWPNTAVTSAPAGILESQKIPPIRETEFLRPVKLTEPRPGVYVFDLGVNIAGWARFETTGNRGQEIVLSFNEQLNDDGTLNTRHLTSHTKGRFQTGRFILRGQGREVYEPRFTYHGFQYVQIEGLSQPPTLDSLTGVRVHTDLAPAGEFICSDEKINRLQTIILRSYLNNLHAIPTDCPHREKMGWMLDGFMTLQMALFNFDAATFYTKWFQDMIDAQEPNGHVPSIVPTNQWGRSKPDGSPPSYSDPWWGGAIILLPWILYLHYGDRRILERGFEAMKKYVDYLGRFSDHLIVRWDLGDWLEPDGPTPYPVRTPVPLTSTAAFFYFANIVSRTAELLDKKSDFDNYAALARNIRDRFNETFFDPDTGLYAKDSQTAQTLALCLGLAPEDKKSLVLQRLIENVHITRQGHLSTGFVGTPFLPHALTDGGRADLVYTLITQETGPSWWQMIKNGDTALWETWRGDRDNSFNHPGFGGIGDWFFLALAGIRSDPASPGFKHMIIKPERVGGLTFVRAGYHSPYGRIGSDWNRDGRQFVITITIPPNTRATIYIPATAVQDVRESGKPALESEGVKFLRMEENRAVFLADSGKYIFQA
jgi:alpha-L-rhamnosidase